MRRKKWLKINLLGRKREIQRKDFCPLKPLVLCIPTNPNQTLYTMSLKSKLFLSNTKIHPKRHIIPQSRTKHQRNLSIPAVYMAKMQSPFTSRPYSSKETPLQRKNSELLIRGYQETVGIKMRTFRLRWSWESLIGNWRHAAKTMQLREEPIDLATHLISPIVTTAFPSTTPQLSNCFYFDIQYHLIFSLPASFSLFQVFWSPSWKSLMFYGLFRYIVGLMSIEV
jgi:hypothetical protein